MRPFSKMYLLPVAAGVLAFWAAPALRAADQTCNSATLQGAYGYTVTGTINPGAVPQLPQAHSER